MTKKMENVALGSKATVGAAIREERTKQKMSLTALAAAVGTSASYLSNIERGKVGVGLGMLARLTNALGGKLAVQFEKTPRAKKEKDA